MGIIRDLYDGEISAGRYVIPKDPKYRALEREISSRREYFESKLSDEDKKKFEKWTELQQDYEDMMGYAAFEYGFKLGAQFVLEIRSEKAGEATLDS